MTASTTTAAPAGRRSPPLLLPRVLRGLGWTLIAAGTLVLLYVVYSLGFTNVATRAAQADLLEEWELEVGGLSGDQPLVGEQPAAGEAPTAAGIPSDHDGAVAVLEFVRPGAETAPVRDGALFVVEGVGIADLQRGPGHYPDTAAPGEPGNFAVAGHRTTYGAPFFDLDELEPGDEVHVTDRAGVRWLYRVREERIVAPDDGWVLGPDPLGTGVPTLTLTTCHPRFSNRERLVVFAELVS